MISDILYQLKVDLDRYLNDPDFDHVYVGETRERIVRLRDDANDLLSILDMPPVTALAADDRLDQTGSSTRSEWLEWMMSDESAVISPIFSQKDLLGRGWSKRLIGEVLGEPDGTAENPHGIGFAPMRCWRQDRVLQAEENPAFRQSCRRIRDEGVPIL